MEYSPKEIGETRASLRSIVISQQKKIAELEKTVRQLTDLVDASKETTFCKNKVDNATKIVMDTYESLTLHNVAVAAQGINLDVHMKGAEGYMEYLLNGVLKDRIVCTDIISRTIIYKGEADSIITDVGFERVMSFLCNSLSDVAFDLCQQYYEHLSLTYSSDEIDHIDTNSAGTDIMRYAINPANSHGFVSDIIRGIAKATLMK